MLKRGDIWTVAGTRDYAGKLRPAVLIQDDRFETPDSIAVCLLTTDSTDLPWLRLRVEPDEKNGLCLPSSLMVDKIAAVPRTKLGSRVGRLADGDLLRLNRAMLVFLGLASSPREP